MSVMDIVHQSPFSTNPALNHVFLWRFFVIITNLLLYMVRNSGKLVCMDVKCHMKYDSINLSMAYFPSYKDNGIISFGVNANIRTAYYAVCKCVNFVILSSPQNVAHRNNFLSRKSILPFSYKYPQYLGGCFNVKMLSHQYKDSHHTDNTVTKLSYLYNGDPHTWKDVTRLIGAHNFIAIIPALYDPWHWVHGMFAAVQTRTGHITSSLWPYWMLYYDIWPWP